MKKRVKITGDNLIGTTLKGKIILVFLSLESHLTSSRKRKYFSPFGTKGWKISLECMFPNLFENFSCGKPKQLT